MEDALDEVKDYLDSNLATYLTTVRTNRSDTDTPDPALICVGHSAKNLYPKMELLPESTPHDYGPDAAPLVRPWLTHNIIVRVTHRSTAAQLVEKALLRYSEAMNRLQEADDTFGGVFAWIQIGEEDYSPMMENQENREALQVLLVPLVCRTL